VAELMIRVTVKRPDGTTLESGQTVELPDGVARRFLERGWAHEPGHGLMDLVKNAMLDEDREFEPVPRLQTM